MLRYADLATSGPSNVDQTDVRSLAAHFHEEQVVEPVFVVATANLTNRINDSSAPRSTGVGGGVAELPPAWPDTSGGWLSGRPSLPADPA